MSDRIEQMRSRVRRLTTTVAPSPWQQLPTITIGGLASVGFSADSSCLLAVSLGGGRSLYATKTGERLARDRDTDLSSWVSADGTQASGIGIVGGVQIPVAGIWGGGLSKVAEDGWSCFVVAPDWPDEQVLLGRPGGDLWSENLGSHLFQVADSEIFEVRSAGFSPDGRSFVVATSGGIDLWAR
jgi:hypothetical protein